jgi:hypothetical protein
MIFKIQHKNDEWLIAPMMGNMQDQIVAVAEGVSLANVTLFNDGTLTGDVVAVWGATIDERAYNYPEIIRGLGINKTFDNRAPTHLCFDYCKGWTKRASGAIVKQAKLVTCFGASIRSAD